MINALFVCIGNSCRSQMAEGFARAYGSDVMNSWSAGLAPAPIVQPLTIEVMGKKNIDISEQFPKSIDELELNSFDVIFNMSGVPFPAKIRGELRIWNVTDPMTLPESVYIAVRDQIEGLVMQFILEIRRGKRKSLTPPPRRNAIPELAPVPGPQQAANSSQNATQTGQTPQRFGFGRVRKTRD